MDVTRHPDTVARLLVPARDLSACMPAYLWRDTLAAAQLSEAQRSSWFPATPLCGLTWTLAGDGWQLDEQGRHTPLPGPCLVTGPRSGPTRYLSHAGVRCFMAAITPEALQALTGLEPGTLKDRSVALGEGLGERGAPWQALNRQLLVAADAAECQRLLEDFVRPRWQAIRADPAQAVPAALQHHDQDWLQHLMLRAVAAGHGRSLRQVERRIKQWSGQSLRALRGISRAEAAFVQVRRELDEGRLVWAALAQEAGYADQAHLCRESRRITGFSPEELRRRLDHEEAFWAYRVWA
jgi:AraC-like DNA-binding protein